MTRTSHVPYRATLATIIVALLFALVPVTGTAGANEHTGTVSGTITTKLGLDGGTAPDGRAVFLDADTGEFVAEAVADAAGDYSIALPAGTYVAVLYNSSDGFNFEDYFPELFRDKPLFASNPDLVKVTAGGTVDVDGTLAPMFDDMFDGTVFTDDIFFLRNFGVTRGCNPPDNTLYCPGDDVTREQMAAFLVRFLGLTQIDQDADFEDIDGSIFHDDIRKLATDGITRGCNPEDGNTEFCPEDNVTRGEMAAFIVRAANLTEIDQDADFRDIDGSIFHDDIRKLATAGITRGCNPDDGNTEFCPEDNVTRGEMAAFLHRTAEFLFGQFAAEGDTTANFDRGAAAAFEGGRADLGNR